MSDEPTNNSEEGEAVVPEEEATVSPDVDNGEGEATPLNDVEVAESERDAYRDALQHLQADFENYRKRMLKQQGETAERANEGFVTRLLPVLDTIDLAKTHDPSGSLEQIASSLTELLTKEGLERIPAVDQSFDPTLHEAVAHAEGDAEGGPKVSEELRAGYRWKGRVIRPTMVKVVG